MKIIRFQTLQGEELYGVADREGPGRVRVIQGGIYDDIVVTDRVEAVATLLPPVVPVNILCLGLNYGKHARETNIANPESPVLFIKTNNTVIGHDAPILLPAAGADQVDYEAELAVVIGRRGKNITVAEACNHILGYTCANDVSARDWQIYKQKKQWARGKSFYTFCPLGPCLGTKDHRPEPDNLPIRLTLNGTVMQDANTADMIFDVASIVSDLSRSMTLEPGTVILTGTPEGVGFTREPPVYLREGDRVTVSIEGIGDLSNPVIREA